MQWIKNLALFSGLIFSGNLFQWHKSKEVFFAFLIFCLVSSSVYIFNDILDYHSDQLHPFKKNRPLASGKLPFPLALFAAFLFSIVSLYLAINLSFFFFLLCLAYISLHFFYTLVLKTIPILDILAIATGFILRIWAGAVIANTHINIWLLLCLISFAMFLSVGKRRSELTLLSSALAGKHRKVLFSYPEKLLDLYISMFANTTWLTYALFTFLFPYEQPRTKVLVFLADLPLAFRSQKWLMLTIPLVIYGIMRYLQLVYQKNEGESPARILITDKPLLSTVIIWLALVIFILYILT